MKTLTQSKNTTILPVLIALMLGCFGLSRTAKAVAPARDGGYSNQHTVEAEDAVLTLNTPASGNWTATGSMAQGRTQHTATLLPNGKVLVAGGVYGGASAELYDPTNGTWTDTGSLAQTRFDHTATLLSNGMVLVAGGFGSGALASAELYDPASGTWTATNRLATARRDHRATLLPNGKVLVEGTSGGASASAELYDSADGSWSNTGSLVTPRFETLPQGMLGLITVVRNHGWVQLR